MSTKGKACGTLNVFNLFVRGNFPQQYNKERSREGGASYGRVGIPEKHRQRTARVCFRALFVHVTLLISVPGKVLETKGPRFGVLIGGAFSGGSNNI